MNRSLFCRQLALAVAALVLNSCLSVQTRHRPMSGAPGSGAGGAADAAGDMGGIALQVFADDDAQQAGTPGPRGLFIELDRREGKRFVPVFRSLEPAWSVMGLPPGEYRLRFPARLDDQGHAVPLDEEARTVQVLAGEVTEVDTVLEHVDKGLIVAGVIAAVALAIFLDTHDLPLPPLPSIPPPPGVLDAVFWISLDAAASPIYGPGGWVSAGPERIPVVTSHFPPDGARVAADRVRITFALSAPLDAHTLKSGGITVLGETSGLLPGQTTYDGDRWWLVWEGDADLPRDETLHVTLSEEAIEDGSGHRLTAPVSFGFTTAP